MLHLSPTLELIYVCVYIYILLMLCSPSVKKSDQIIQQTV